MSKLLFCYLLVAFVAHQYVEAVPLDGRIIGGAMYGTMKDHEYQAGVFYKGDFYCGGSIIDISWILTSARCLENSTDPSDFTVRYGDYRRENGTLLKVVRLIPHADYSRTAPFSNDIALLQLADPVIFSETAKSIALTDDADVVVEGAKATISGWGTNIQNGNLSIYIKVAKGLTVYNLATCREKYDTYEVANMTFCAGDSSANFCDKDEGGPLVIGSVQVGVASWSAHCGRSPNHSYPGIFTNVGLFRDWIRRHSGI